MSTTKRFWRFSLLCAVAILALVASSCSSDSPTGLDPNLVSQGQTVYQANCMRCHGAQGEGQPNWKVQNPDKTYPPPPHDSTGHTWHHPDGVLYRIVRDGGIIYEDPGFKSGMPTFGTQLKPEEIRAVLTYIKTFWTQEQRELQAAASKQDPFP